MKDLLEIREQINNIDDQLVELWKERMALSWEIAEYKRENNLPIFDEQREKELLERIGDLAGEELNEYARELYQKIMSISRSYQEKEKDNK